MLGTQHSQVVSAIGGEDSAGKELVDWGTSSLTLMRGVFPAFFFFNFFFVFLPFFGPLPWHMEVPRLEVKSELQLAAYTTATATQDPSRVCHLYLSSRQRQILNPLI